MALPDLMKENENYGQFQIYDLTTQNDGYGGYMSTYTPGATFDAVLVLDDSIQAQVAEKQGVTGVYTLTFDNALRLPWHTVFRKISGDGLVGTFFRVTSKDDKVPPKGATLKFRNVNVEEYVPTDVVVEGQTAGV